MLGILAFFIGLFLVICSIPLKTIQLAFFAKNTKTKIETKLEKAKDSKASKGLSKLKEKLSNSGKKPAKSTNKDINKLRNTTNKTKRKAIFKTIDLKTKALDLLVNALRGLSSFLFATGQSLMATGIMAVLIMLIVIIAIIAACASVIIFLQASNSIDIGAINGSDTEAYDSANTVEEAVRVMGEWYVNHVATYQGVYNADGNQTEFADKYYKSVKDDKTKYFTKKRTISLTKKVNNGYYYCPLVDAFVADDEYGFAVATASYMCFQKICLDESDNSLVPQTPSKTYTEFDGLNHMFRRYTAAELGGQLDLRAGDILVRDDDVMIFVDINHYYSWNKVRNTYPEVGSTRDAAGGYILSYKDMTVDPPEMMNTQPYLAAYRYMGALHNYTVASDEEMYKDDDPDGGDSGGGDSGGGDSGGGDSGGDNPADSSDFVATGNALVDMSNWYLTHVATYWAEYERGGYKATTQAENYYNSVKGDKSKYYVSNLGTATEPFYVGMYYCELTGTWVRDDCTGFAAALATLASGEKVQVSSSRNMINSWDATNHGYTKYSYTQVDVSTLPPGTILVCNGHAEVVVDSSGKTFGWGYVHNSYPQSKTITKTSDGIRIGKDSRNYITVYILTK